MKHYFLLLGMGLIGVGIQAQNLDELEQEWSSAKKAKDSLYETKDNCDALMSYFSKEVLFYEKGQPMPYEWLVAYCPKLPKNLPKPDKIEVKKVFLSENTAFDVLDETFFMEDGPPYKKTTTTIWKRLVDGWKIVHINIGMHKTERDSQN